MSSPIPLDHGVLPLLRDAMDSVQPLPPASNLSPSVVSFLDYRLNSEESLALAPTLVSELETQCSSLDQSLIDLNRKLESALGAHSSFTDRIHGLFDKLNPKLIDFESFARSHRHASGRGGGVDRADKMLGEELPALANEVARMETVRIYAETAMKLDMMVGDIEDAVSSAINKNLRKHSTSQNSEDYWSLAIRNLRLTEELLSSVSKANPQWTHLVSAVDHRVDRALAILRPQAIANHRALLVSLGWPPPLSNMSASELGKKSSQVPNPLSSMRGDLKLKYSENFLALCSLQELQKSRKSRQLDGCNQEISLYQPLWAIEELVTPISLLCQHHFSKWDDEPEFIFALVYKITREYLECIDQLLQPIVDEAMLVGYSCREEWISAMVSSLSTYLAKEVFPNYVRQLDEEDNTDIGPEATIAWLHLIDLMISFDKRIKSLVEDSGIFFSLEEDNDLQKISCLSVFGDQPHWLELWAHIELRDAKNKLKLISDDERSWTGKVQVADHSSTPENYKSPMISRAFLNRLSSLVDHCRSLPNVSLRSRFLRLAGAPFITKFLDCLLLRCQEAEGLTALTDDDALIKVSNSINAARYIETTLREWCEDIFFLEMAFGQDNQTKKSNNLVDYSGLVENQGKGIIDEEIRKLEEFRIEWVEKISVIVLRGFDAQCRDYIKNRKQWQEKVEEGWTVSKSFIGALDYLQGKVVILEKHLNEIEFVGLWRSLAYGVDRMVFNGIVLGSVKFHDNGVERFSVDLEALFGVFRGWCLRPQRFFPKMSESLMILKIGKEEVEKTMLGGEKWMKDRGISHLTVAEAEKIVKSRVFAI